MRRKNDPRDFRGMEFGWYERAGEHVVLVFFRGSKRHVVKLSSKQFRLMLESARDSEDWSMRRAKENRDALGDPK